ncbi:MAG: lyase [Candidatus Tectomicrobia bacterium]|nr:lyase [Candidatus Tectomicrobia bacterium]
MRRKQLVRFKPAGAAGLCALAALALWAFAEARADVAIRAFPLPPGARPHDVAPAPDGPVWYTAQYQGALGRLDPKTGGAKHIPLGAGSSPHGVIVGPDGAPWITDGGLNAIVRVDPKTFAVTRFPLPEPRGYANLNTAAFDGRGVLWFTGQSGIYGSLDPKSGAVQVYDAPRGRGPYGITGTPQGGVYFASLAGSFIARVHAATGAAEVIEPPTPKQGARRVWSDSKGRIWVSEWNSGNVSRFDPADRTWRTWRLPGERPRTYAVYVDDQDKVWLSDFAANAVVRFDPETETFRAFPSPRTGANVRQILGRPGEVWAPESGTDHLVLFKTR